MSEVKSISQILAEFNFPKTYEELVALHPHIAKTHNMPQRKEPEVPGYVRNPGAFKEAAKKYGWDVRGGSAPASLSAQARSIWNELRAWGVWAGVIWKTLKAHTIASIARLIQYVKSRNPRSPGAYFISLLKRGLIIFFDYSIRRATAHLTRAGSVNEYYKLAREHYYYKHYRHYGNDNSNVSNVRPSSRDEGKPGEGEKTGETLPGVYVVDPGRGGWFPFAL